MGLVANFQWKSLITSGIKSGIGGVVGGVVGYGLAWTLDSIFGLEVGKPGKVEQKQQIIDALNQINDEMAEMNQELVEISTQLSNLSTEMTQDFLKTISAIQMSPVITAYSNIETAWKAVLSQSTNSAAVGQTPDGTASKLSSDILTIDGGIPSQITVITNNLLPAQASTGLLDTWTSSLILQVLQGSSLRNSYGWLEQSFLQYLQYLFYGHSLVIAAQIQQGWSASISPEQNQANAQVTGENYIKYTAAPNLAKLTQMFLQCVYRLTLCTYNVPVPTNNPTGFGPFTTQSDADYILGRANLLAWQINRADTDPANPGIVVTSFVRPSQILGNAGPSLCPNSSYQASGGKVFALEYGYSGKWYKVIDFSDAGLSQLRDYNDSNITIVNYSWETPTPNVGTSVGSTGVFSKIVPGYYDTNSLAPVSEASSTTVVYGFATDLTSITTNLLWSNPVTLQGASSQTLHKDNDSSKIVMLQYSPRASGGGGVCSASLTASLMVTGDYKDDAKSMESWIGFPLVYQGTANATLILCGQASASMSVAPGGAPAGYSPVPITVERWIEIPGRQSISSTIASISTPDDHDPPTTNSYSWEYFQSLSIQPNEGVSPTFCVQSTAEEQSKWKNYNNGYNNDNASNSSVGWTVSQLIASWPQPTVS